MHTMVVTGIDWSSVTGKIVTCSHDVNAFVWTYDGSQDTWTAKVSILKIERAAIRAKWSPDGTKFAVATGSKVASICYFEPSQDWWVSQLTKRGQHKSTILDVAWHPSSQLFATGCCDFKCRIFSGFIPKVDTVGVNTVFGSMESTKFGQLIAEFEATGAWVEAVAWSPSGDGLAFTGHGSSISFVDLSSGNPVCTTIRTQGLPFTRVLFLNDNVCVAAGHDFNPTLFQGQGSSWEDLGVVDKGNKQAGGKNKGAFASSFNKFKGKVKTGQTGNLGENSLKTLHTNLITDLNLCGDGFSTSAQDGQIIVWNKAAIKKGVPSVSI